MRKIASIRENRIIVAISGYTEMGRNSCRAFKRVARTF